MLCGCRNCISCPPMELPDHNGKQMANMGHWLAAYGCLAPQRMGASKKKQTFLSKPSSYKNLTTTKPIELWNRKMKFEQSYVMYIWGCNEECVSCLQGYQKV